MFFLALLWLSGAAPFLVMTLPGLRQIGYVALPSPTLRMLVISGIVAPGGVAIDQSANRLFVTDSAQQKIFWYQLIAIGDKLITDGQQHIAVESVEANWVTVDGSGNLYFSGKILVLPPLTAVEGVWKHPALYVAAGQTVESVNLWNSANTGAPAKLAAPSGLTNDNLSVFWGNAQGGLVSGSVVKATTTVPSLSPETAVSALAANEDMVHGLCVTPNFLFYSSPDGVFGINKGKVGATCADNACVTISADFTDPQGIVWDGDGTIYVADAGKGAVYSFPAGGLQDHVLVKVADAPKVTGLALLQLRDFGSPSFSALMGLLWAFTFA